MNIRFFPASFFALAALIFTLTGFAVPAQAEDRLKTLLEQTGLKYSALDMPDAWKIAYDGDDGKTVTEYLTYSNDRKEYALMFVTVVDREDNYAFSYAALKEALKLSNDDVGVKFVLDEKHGDIDCQSEVYLGTATPESLKRALDAVASTAMKESTNLNGL